MATDPKPAHSVLEAAFRIRPGEARLVGLMFAYLLAVVSTFIIGRTVRDTLFLHRVSLEALPLMYVAVAAAVSIAAYGYSRVANRLRRDRLVVRTLGTFFVVTLGFYGLILARVPGDWPYAALYVAVEIIGALSMIQFWTLAGDVFNSRQAKRLFGFIGAGGVLANVLCGFAIGALAPAIGAEQLLLVVAVLFLACIGFVRAAARLAEDDLDQAFLRPRSRGIGVARDSEAVLHDTHLKLIAGLVVVSFFTITLVDYQFKVIARTSMLSEAQLAAFFGNFQGVAGVIACLTQVFVTGRLIERHGLILALVVLPGMMALGVGSMFLVPLLSPLFAVTLTKGAENIFRYTINDATTQVLYLPVRSDRRSRAKAFIDGILKPMSIGVGGLLLYGLGRRIPPEELALELTAAVAVLLVGWLLVVGLMRRPYADSLMNSLRTGRADFAGAWTPAVDQATVASLRARLRSGDEQTILPILELLPDLDLDLDDEVEALLSHEAPGVRIAALERLGAKRRFQSIGAVRERLEDPEQSIRAAAVTAFCAIGRERSIDTVRRFLDDPDLDPRAAAIAALIQHCSLEGTLTAGPSLKALLAHEDAKARIYGVRVLGEIRVPTFYHPLLTLLQDPDPRVQLAAVQAAGAMRSPELVSLLIYKLADKHCGRAAAQALAAYGAAVEPTLLEVLSKSAEDLAIRRRIPGVLGAVGGERALGRLIDTLGTRDPALRAAAAKEAARLVDKNPRAPVDVQKVRAALDEEFEGAFRTLAVLDDLGLGSGTLLEDALDARLRQRVALIFRFLEILYPRRDIRLVEMRLGSSNRVLRANAVEAAENIVRREDARRLVPLIDDLPREIRLARGRDLYPDIPRKTMDEWVFDLLEHRHPWTVACALEIVAQRQLHHLGPTVVRLTSHRDETVRETAFVTLAKIGGEHRVNTDDLQRLARAAAMDSSARVKQASDFLLAALGAEPRLKLFPS